MIPALIALWLISAIAVTSWAARYTRIRPPEECEFIIYVKPDGERYLFLWDDTPESKKRLVLELARNVADPELSFDAADYFQCMELAREPVGDALWDVGNGSGT